MDEHLIQVLNAPGKGFQEAAAELGRTICACQRRIAILERMSGMELYVRESGDNTYRSWTKHEESELLRLHDECGKPFKTIGEILGRTSYACLRRWERMTSEDRREERQRKKQKKREKKQKKEELPPPTPPTPTPEPPSWMISATKAYEMMESAGYTVEEKARTLRAFRLFLDTMPRTDPGIHNERWICSRLIARLEGEE